MKLLLVFSISACSFTAFGQVDQEEILKNKLGELYKGGLDTEKWRFQPLPQKPDELYFGDGLAQAPPKFGIYALPQDGMPCIVPDTRSIVSIPQCLSQCFPAFHRNHSKRLPRADGEEDHEEIEKYFRAE